MFSLCLQSPNCKASSLLTLLTLLLAPPALPIVKAQEAADRARPTSDLVVQAAYKLHRSRWATTLYRSPQNNASDSPNHTP
jgi:hypothetical protein